MRRRGRGSSWARGGRSWPWAGASTRRAPTAGRARRRSAGPRPGGHRRGAVGCGGGRGHVFVPTGVRSRARPTCRVRRRGEPRPRGAGARRHRGVADGPGQTECRRGTEHQHRHRRDEHAGAVRGEAPRGERRPVPVSARRLERAVLPGTRAGGGAAARPSAFVEVGIRAGQQDPAVGERLPPGFVQAGDAPAEGRGSGTSGTSEHGGGAGRIGEGRHHRELVTARAVHGVHVAQRSPEGRRQRSQGGVSRGVPARVVDGLQPVEVDHRHRQVEPRAWHRGERPDQLLVQCQPVGAAREGVGTGLGAAAFPTRRRRRRA